MTKKKIKQAKLQLAILIFLAVVAIVGAAFITFQTRFTSKASEAGCRGITTQSSCTCASNPNYMGGVSVKCSWNSVSKVCNATESKCVADIAPPTRSMPQPGQACNRYDGKSSLCNTACGYPAGGGAPVNCTYTASVGRCNNTESKCDAYIVVTPKPSPRPSIKPTFRPTPRPTIYINRCYTNTSPASCVNRCGKRSGDSRNYQCAWSTKTKTCYQTGNICTN